MPFVSYIKKKYIFKKFFYFNLKLVVLFAYENWAIILYL